MSPFSPAESNSESTLVLQGSILIIDEDAVTRDGAARILGAVGYRCHTAFTADEARQLLKQREFDLVIAEMQGNLQPDLVVQNMADARLMPPILVVTGQPTLESAVRAVQSRVVGYLVKPLSEEKLLRVVRREVDAYRAYRFLCSRRTQLEDTLWEARQLERAMRDPRWRSADDAMGAYLALASGQFFTAVRDICTLVEGVVAREGAALPRERIASMRPSPLLDALREAVLVLERTKTSFKSKELGDLRRKLETLLIGPAAPQAVVPPERPADGSEAA
jgi:DNA-binding response OmpR family regulator